MTVDAVAFTLSVELPVGADLLNVNIVGLMVGVGRLDVELTIEVARVTVPLKKYIPLRDTVVVLDPPTFRMRVVWAEERMKSGITTMTLTFKVLLTGMPFEFVPAAVMLT